MSKWIRRQLRNAPVWVKKYSSPIYPGNLQFYFAQKIVIFRTGNAKEGRHGGNV
ncbi:hypothetical protein [Echinicola sp. 20G]|uniref:hypothetical protein n=1 Tax=Echinicola sp. 20G TaxID=2781961 RepID=UPI001F2923B9|nr:hypothetical protein [Echinicola sp. 20G]